MSTDAPAAAPAPTAPDAAAPALPPIRNVPFVPAPPPPRPADTAPVARPAPSAREYQDMSPQDRFALMRGDTPGPRLGDVQLSDSDYAKLTYSEKIEYAERRSASA